MPTHYFGAVTEILALDTFIKLTRAIEPAGERLARRNITGGLTRSQFRVIERLYLLAPMQHGELCAKPLLSMGDLTLLVEKLKKRGLVRRERSLEDPRVVVDSLTETGRALIEQIFQATSRRCRRDGALAAEEL